MRKPPGHFAPSPIAGGVDAATLVVSRRPALLGENLWRGVLTCLFTGAAIFAGILLIDFGVAKFQEIQLRERGARVAKLAEMALSRLQGEVQSVSDLGDG